MTLVALGKFLSPDSDSFVANAFVSSHLDYYYSIFRSLRGANLHRIQCIQNTLACIVGYQHLASYQVQQYVQGGHINIQMCRRSNFSPCNFNYNTCCCKTGKGFDEIPCKVVWSSADAMFVIFHLLLRLSLI